MFLLRHHKACSLWAHPTHQFGLEAPHLFIHVHSPISSLIFFVWFGLEAVPFTVHFRVPQFVFPMIGEYGQRRGIDVRPSTRRPLLKQPVQRLCRFKQSVAPTKPLIQISSCFVLCSTCVTKKASTYSMLTPKLLIFNTKCWFFVLNFTSANYTRLPFLSFNINMLQDIIWPV